MRRVGGDGKSGGWDGRWIELQRRVKDGLERRRRVGDDQAMKERRRRCEGSNPRGRKDRMGPGSVGLDFYWVDPPAH